MNSIKVCQDKLWQHAYVKKPAISPNIENGSATEIGKRLHDSAHELSEDKNRFYHRANKNKVIPPERTWGSIKAIVSVLDKQIS